MKKPPPSRSNQKEPPYQSPPRPPLQQEPYQTQPPPPLHQQEPSQAPRRRGPVITYIPAPRIINTPNENYKSLVQRLTGKPPTSTAPPSSSPYTSAAPNYTTSAAFDDSPAMEMYAELERTKPRLGFAGGGVCNQLPDLSPGSTSIWPELLSTTTTVPQDLEFTDSLLPSPSYWNQQRELNPPPSSIPHGDGGPLERHRFDLGNDTRTSGSDNDMSLRSVQTPSLPSEEVGGFNGFGGLGRPGGDNMYMGGELMSGRSGAIGFGQQDLAGRPSRELLCLPPDASSTLFVEGLPSDCSMREVAHIFRHFSGYKEVRFVTKDSTQSNGDPIVLCFVDFENPACAAIARNELQGYRMDEEEPDSNILQIQFSRNPGPRPG